MTIRQEMNAALDFARRNDWKLEREDVCALCAKISFLMEALEQVSAENKEHARDLRVARQEVRALKKIITHGNSCGGT